MRPSRSSSATLVTDHSNGEEYVYSADYSRRGTVSGLPILAVVGAKVEL